MGFKDDKIKVLEMICASLPPLEIMKNEGEELSFYEDDFMCEGLSYNTVINVFRDIYDEGPIKIFNSNIIKDNIRGIKITVTCDIEHYMRITKYPDYEKELIQQEMEEMAGESPITYVPTSKILITIDSKKGIYKDNDFTKSYTVKSGSNREKIILFLCKKDWVKITELEKETKQPPTLIIKEIKNINKLFREKISVAYDLIISIPTGGYSLNRDKFGIR